jgi:carbamate kinase
MRCSPEPLEVAADDRLPRSSAIELGHGTRAARALATATPAELAELHLPAGSIGPKAQAVARFVRDAGDLAAIGRLADAAAILAGRAGTRVLIGPLALDATRPAEAVA